jgi:predicted nucleic acid-binding protein
MADRVKNYFWDSCCFIAYLNNEVHAYDIPSLEQFIDDAKNGKAVLHTSTIALAEIRPSFLKQRSIGSFSEFMDDMNGAVVLADPSPNIMISAGHYKDLKYTKSNSKGRHLSTPDAIMLATCIHLMDDAGVSIDSFHTYDNGGKRGDEGRAVPLLTYHEWCSGLDENEFASRIIRLPRTQPLHPEPRFV